MSQAAYALVGLTALVAGLVAVLVFAVLRFVTAAREMRGQLRDGGSERAFMMAALQEAIEKLKAREREMAARAEASERLSDEIISSLNSGLLVVGLDGTVRTLNPAGRRLLRVQEPAVTGGYRELLGGATPLASAIDECLASRRAIVRRAVEIPGADGSSLHFGVTVSPLFDSRHELHGASCLFSDLTDVVNLEEQLRLKDSLARLGELTAGLAHEFRNGLATIHGYGRLIDPSNVPPAYRPYVEGIRQETSSLGEVVSNFLNFARPTEPALEPVDLHAVAVRAAGDMRAEAAAHGGEITVQGEFATVDGDEVLLRQAIGNLLRNASEACASSSIPPRIVIEGGVDRPQGIVSLTVRDNGPGIDAAAAERIFRPFFSTKGRGTGLGLALVQKIAVTHNGRVTASTHPGGGASFKITLPLPDSLGL
jgi:two-component system sensor histidine kinase HydH